MRRACGESRRVTAGLIGQVVVLTLILMGVLLYKHRGHAGEFLRSFASFEGFPRKKPGGAAWNEYVA